MSGLDREEQLNDPKLRMAVAVAVSVVALGALLTRSGDAVDWSLLSPTVAVFWLWSMFEGFPRWPVYLLGLSTPVALNLVASDDEVSMFIVVITIAVLTARAHYRVPAWTIFGTWMALILVLGLTEAISSFAWPNWMFGMVIAAACGEFIHRYAQNVEELESARALVVDQAAVNERRRIARDVHDLVGHSLSVMLLHVTGARHLVHTDPDEAERALEFAESAGRESLAEIRRTVNMLRDEGDDGAQLPSPDLSDVDELINQYLTGGVDVGLTITGDVGAVEGASALAGYRIIQEALTNASRHTVDARVEVTIDVSERDYDVAVRNHGGTTIDLGKGAGFGLISMRERARSVGGLLVAGPTPDGWTVEATLPINSVESVR